MTLGHLEECVLLRKQLSDGLGQLAWTLHVHAMSALTPPRLHPFQDLHGCLFLSAGEAASSSRGLGHSSDELVAVQARRAPGTDAPEDRAHP